MAAPAPAKSVWEKILGMIQSEEDDGSPDIIEESESEDESDEEMEVEVKQPDPESRKRKASDSLTKD